MGAIDLSGLEKAFWTFVWFVAAVAGTVCFGLGYGIAYWIHHA